MKNKTFTYIIITIVIAVLLYLFIDNTKKEKEQNEFMPPPAFSVLNELPSMISSTSSVSVKENLYINSTLGLSIKLPSKINLNKETAELRKYELGSGEDKFGQQYKYYEIDFSDNTKSESSSFVTIKVKGVPYSNIDEWLEKYMTRGGNFPEDTVKFERKNMFGTDVYFGYDDWNNMNSLPSDENDSTEYVYVIKNNLLYRFELNNFLVEERKSIWNSIKLDI